MSVQAKGGTKVKEAVRKRIGEPTKESTPNPLTRTFGRSSPGELNRLSPTAEVNAASVARTRHAWLIEMCAYRVEREFEELAHEGLRPIRPFGCSSRS
jgi:hypothetical protein